MKRMCMFLTTLGALTLYQGCQPAAFKDFDIGATAWDPNPLPRNPKWGKQIEMNQLPDPGQSCPTNSSNPADWKAAPNCTKMDVYFNSGTWCGPHVNFIPVCYEGVVTWESHSNSVWDDDDYSLNVTRSDNALYTTQRSEIHMEFNSEETVDNWDDTHTWWDRFHHDGVDHNDATAASMIDGDSVIVIGLVTLDLPHPGTVELHPVYAMFVHLAGNDPSQSTWAFFVRNWGDEGFCASGEENMYLRDDLVKVEIPNAAVFTSANAWMGAQNADDLNSMGWSVQPSSRGMVLTFHLLHPESQSWFVGDLTFTNRVQVNATKFLPPVVRRAKEEDGRKELSEKIMALPDSSRTELYQQLYTLLPRNKPRRSDPRLINSMIATETQPKDRAARVEGGNLVRLENDARLAQRREAKQQFVEKFLNDRGIK